MPDTLPCPRAEHDHELVARKGSLELTVCRRCGMRFVRGLDGGERVPGEWVAWLNGKTDERPAGDESKG